jgi:transcriptional regulator with XRE-family HTH domain
MFREGFNGPRETVRTAARGIRKANKLNQAELAEKVGIETKYLSNIETGRRSPSFEKTVALAKALEVPMSARYSRLSMTKPIPRCSRGE